MIKDALQYFLEKSEDRHIDIEGRPYCTNKLFPVETPVPDALIIHTLTGVRDYILSDPDGLGDNRKLVLQVHSAREVSLSGVLLPPFMTRSYYIKAIYKQSEFEFGRFMDIEQFIIELQSKFIPDETTANLLQIVGNVTDGTVNTFADDGITQQVTSKSGIGRVINATVPNPVTLVPYRSFNEIDQPEGKFVFHLRSSESSRPLVGLFQADAGVWENVAADRIRQWFVKELAGCENVLIIA